MDRRCQAQVFKLETLDSIHFTQLFYYPNNLIFIRGETYNQRRIVEFLASFKCRRFCDDFHAGTIDFWIFGHNRSNKRRNSTQPVKLYTFFKHPVDKRTHLKLEHKTPYLLSDRPNNILYLFPMKLGNNFSIFLHDTLMLLLL